MSRYYLRIVTRIYYLWMVSPYFYLMPLPRALDTSKAAIDIELRQEMTRYFVRKISRKKALMRSVCTFLCAIF